MALTLTVRPRLQRETWSLYWREAMATETTCAPDVALPIGGGGGAGGGSETKTPLSASATVRDVLRAAAEACGWPPVGSLVRLEGFEGPFERCLVRGSEVGLDEPAAKYAVAAGVGEASAAAAATGGAAAASAPPPPPALVYVRTVLAAEGWRLANDPNDVAGYSTSDTDGSSDEESDGGGKA
jgi:hypothetical protein